MIERVRASVSVSRWGAVPQVMFAMAMLVLSASQPLLATDFENPPLQTNIPIPQHPLAPADASLLVRFAGVSTLLFEDRDTKWMVDGFFSRPSALAVLFSKIGPDQGEIDKNLARLGSPRLAAVVPAHSHYDHALDSPEVARKTGAVLIGSESTLNIGRGYGLQEERLEKASSNFKKHLKEWTLTFIASRHGPAFNDVGLVRTIKKPLIPPRYQFAWREGQTWAILIEHQNGARMLVNASANYPAGGFKNVRAEVVFLGVGMLGSRTRAERNELWKQSVICVGARKVIPVHWDDFSRSLDQPLVPLPSALDRLDVTLAHFGELAKRDGVELVMPPTFAPFDPTLPRANTSAPDCTRSRISKLKRRAH